MKQKNKKPTISVIMAAYNSEKYTAEAIESILNQTFKDFEFIIINDASTDKTLDIIQKYAKKDKRIKLINNKRNLGVSIVRNVGLKITSGEYIAIMDSDDISPIKRLEIEIKYLQYHKDIFLVSGSYNTINYNSKFLGKNILNYSSGNIENALIKKKGLIINSSTVMFRNIGTIRYRKKVLCCEDKDLWLRLISQGKKIVVLPIILSNYRLHNNSISLNNQRKIRYFSKIVTFWHSQRKKKGYDSYESFNPKKALKFKEDFLRADSSFIKSKEIKLIFKNSYDIRNFRREIKNFWKHYGLFKWKFGIIYYLISFMPSFMIKMFKRIIFR